MSHNRSYVAILVTVAVVVLPGAAIAQQTVGADRFVDSAGVNIHLHYDDTVYRNQFPLIRSRLIELGVRHVRDGLIDTTWLPYYERHNSLGEAGIKATFITRPNDSPELMAQYPGRMRDVFGAYEAPNEYDWSGGPDWDAKLRASLSRLRSLRSDPRAAPFPVIGPSLRAPGSYAQLGDVSAFYDMGNLHNYFAGRHPGTPGWGANGYGSIAWNLGMVGPYAGGKPIVTTETGYQDDLSLVDAIPPDIVARYMPRVLLEQFRAGIRRTFLYELADFPRSGRYGLLHADGSPKPAFNAVKSLLNLLSDPGPAFTPQHLGYSVDGGDDDLRHMAFQKRDGTYYLALWRAVPGYIVESRQHVAVLPQRITVTTAAPMRVLRKHTWQHDGSLSTTSSLLTTSTFPVDVSDALTMIELVAPAPEGLVPGVPGILSAIVDFLRVLLQWEAPRDGGAPTGYTVEASTRSDFSNAVALPVGSGTQLAVASVAPGNYFVRVRASNAHGHGDASSVSSFTVGGPAAPELAAIQTSRSPVTLSWSPSMGAQQYVLSAGTSPGASDVAVVPMGTATAITAPVPAGVRFYVSVAAVNAHGAARSNEVTFAVAPAQAPGAPTLHAAQVAGRHVTLTWTPGTGGMPDDYVLAVGNAPGAANLAVLPVGPVTAITAHSPFTGPVFVRVFARNAHGVGGSNEIAFSVQ